MKRAFITPKTENHQLHQGNNIAYTLREFPTNMEIWREPESPPGMAPRSTISLFRTRVQKATRTSSTNCYFPDDMVTTENFSILTVTIRALYLQQILDMR